MLIKVVGATGSGKSLYDSYKSYSELTLIMHNGKSYPFYQFYKRKYSHYDWVVKNSNFNDGRGNFTRFVQKGNQCKCSPEMICYDEDNYILNELGEHVANIGHWEYDGHCVGITDLNELYDMSVAPKPIVKLCGWRGFLPNCLVLLDEGGTQFNNRDWDKMPAGYELFLTSHRHNVTNVDTKRFDIYIYMQQIDQVEITMDRVRGHVFLIRPLFGFPSDPTRPFWWHKIPGVYIQTYWQHEVRKVRPTMYTDSKGVPIQVSPHDDIEALIYFNWYLFPRKWFFGSKNKFVQSYSTIDRVRELKRTKGR